MYNEWYIWLENILIEKLGKPSGFIYLRCDPEVSLKRLKIRSRNEESSVSLEYLEMLHKAHDNWLMTNKKDFNSCVIDVNEDFENNEVVRNHIFNQIDTFINKEHKFSYEY
jgi:deoxyadenosine/deoxycytidine kinase